MEICEYLYKIVKHFHLCEKKKTDKQRNKRKFENRLSRQAGRGRGGGYYFLFVERMFIGDVRRFIPNTSA